MKTASDNTESHQTVGLLVVHGIGDQDRGETPEKLVEALRNAATEPIATTIRSTDVRDVDFAGSDRTLRIYEVYWADVAGMRGSATKGAFDAELLQVAAQFPRLNRRAGLYPEQEGRLGVRMWSQLLVLFAGILYLALSGLKLLGAMVEGARQASRHRGRHRSAPAVESWRAAKADGLPIHRRIRRFAASSAATAREGAEQAAYGWLDRELDEVAGDIFTYVEAANPNTPPGSPADAILRRFDDALRQAAHDGCSEIHVLAHSLGTVIAYHALAGLRGEADDGTSAARAAVTHIWTIGSPLDKVAFVWPSLANLERPAALAKARWRNYSNPLDPVSGRLDRFASWGVVNQTVWAGGLFRSHVIYEETRRFLRDLSEAIFGVSVIPRRSPWSALTAVAESVLAPLLLFVAMMAGLFLPVYAGLVAWGIKWLLGTVVGVASSSAGSAIIHWSGPWLSIGFGGLILLVMVWAGPRSRAPEAHRKWHQPD